MLAFLFASLLVGGQSGVLLHGTGPMFYIVLMYGTWPMFYNVLVYGT